MPNAMKLQGRARRPPIPRLLRSTQSRSRGQAMVEFALVVPIFLVVLCGILYFGFMLYSKMSIINAAREGAHYGIILDPRDLAFVAKVSGQVSAARRGAEPELGDDCDDRLQGCEQRRHRHALHLGQRRHLPGS